MAAPFRLTSAHSERTPVRRKSAGISVKTSAVLTSGAFLKNMGALWVKKGIKELNT